MTTHDMIELPEHDCLYESTNEQGYIDLEPAYRKSTVLRLLEADRKRIAELEAELQELQRQWVEHDTLGCPTAKTGIYASEADRKRRTPPNEPFAIVIDRMYEGEGPSLAYWNGENYQFSDGDCYNREGDTLDGYTAEFLTDHQLEKRLFDDRKRRGEPVRQYYYQVSGCQAEKATQPNCICWHDKGTGVFKDMAEGDRPHGVMLTWRDKPQPAEPVKVPSDDEIMSVVRYSTVGSAAIQDDEWCAFARAILARYGNAAQPVVFTDANCEERFIEHEANACPYCGGSGHKDDVQPAASAEPLKVPSEIDIFELWSGDPTHSQPIADKGKVLAFARALLARYGQQAHTSVPEPLKYGREWKDHYVTGWNNCRAAMLADVQAQQDDPTPEEEEAWQQMEGRS